MSAGRSVAEGLRGGESGACAFGIPGLCPVCVGMVCGGCGRPYMAVGRPMKEEEEEADAFCSLRGSRATQITGVVQRIGMEKK
jgi:hypothetical protein